MNAHCVYLQNYRSCYRLESTMGDLTKLYEVMNITGVTAIHFAGEYNSLYIFSLRIIDPNYRLVVIFLRIIDLT